MCFYDFLLIFGEKIIDITKMVNMQHLITWATTRLCGELNPAPLLFRFAEWRQVDFLD